MTTSAPVRSIQFIVPLPPNAANNVGGHFMVDVRKKRSYWRTVELRLHARRIPKPPWPKPKPGDKFRITWEWHVWGIMDIDNLYRRGKPLLDWLRAWEYIYDDNAAHLEIVHPPVQMIDRRNIGIVLTIEAL